jgi:large subunit ribosomal protein L6
MSRIGKLPIQVPSGVSCRMVGDTFTAKGPKGEHSERIPSDIRVNIEAAEIKVTRPSEQKRHRALHGLSRTLVANSILGVSEGFSKKLEIKGVGYKAEIQGKKLILSVGYSSPVEYPFPEGIDIKAETPTVIAVSGINKQRVGQVAAEIRNFRKPEPYKGKGVRYFGEVVRQKAGKTAGK